MTLSRFALLCAVFALPAPADAVPVDCNTLNTLGQFIAATDGCFVQDKLFTDFSYTGGGTVTASNVDVDVAFGVGTEIHGLTLTPNAGSPVWTTGFTFGYTISVDPPDPLVGIAGASLQINLGVLANPASAVSTKSNGLVQSALFGDETDTDLFAPVSSLTSSTVVTIPAGGFLISLEEHYVQAIIPEPQSLLLIGVGLAGLALGSSRRRP
jgi:hypothetical protein